MFTDWIKDFTELWNAVYLSKWSEVVNRSELLKYYNEGYPPIEVFEILTDVKNTSNTGNTIN